MYYTIFFLEFKPYSYKAKMCNLNDFINNLEILNQIIKCTIQYFLEFKPYLYKAKMNSNAKIVDSYICKKLQRLKYCKKSYLNEFLKIFKSLIK